MEEDEDEEEIRKAFGKNIIKLEYDDVTDVETESVLPTSNETTTTLEEKETEMSIPVDINSQKRKQPSLFKQPLAPPMKKQKQLLTLAVVKKSKIESAPVTQRKPSSLTSLLASYNDDDDDHVDKL